MTGEPGTADYQLSSCGAIELSDDEEHVVDLIAAIDRAGSKTRRLDRPTLPALTDELGKNNDQIVRLSHEPASLLVVQHCHEILPAVRETLRAFAIQPGPLARRYCLMDGKDSLRLLTAYDLLDCALTLTVAEKQSRKK